MRLKITAAVLGLLVCSAAHAGGLGDLSKLPEERQKVLQDKYEKKLLGLPGPEAKADPYDVLTRLPKGYLSFFKALEKRQKELAEVGKEKYLEAVKEKKVLEKERRLKISRKEIEKITDRIEELDKTISNYRRFDRSTDSLLVALAEMVVIGGDNMRRADILKRLPDYAVPRYIQLQGAKSGVVQIPQGFSSAFSGPGRTSQGGNSRAGILPGRRTHPGAGSTQENHLPVISRLHRKSANQPIGTASHFFGPPPPRQDTIIQTPLGVV